MKKTLSLILALLMVASVVSFGAVSVSADNAVDLVAMSSDGWTYVVGGADLTFPEGWQVGKNIGEWKTDGIAPMGNGQGGFNATFIDGAKAAAVKEFQVVDADKCETLELGVRYDEDPVVYLNGTEVFSAEMWHDGSFKVVDITAYSDLLVEGTNYIAIELKQTSGGFGFDLYLKATGVTPLVPFETLVASGSNGWTYTCTNDGGMEWPANWQKGENIEGWETEGVAPFGNGYFNPHSTELSVADGGKAAAVKEFLVTDAANCTDLELWIRYDEDPKVYINGTLVTPEIAGYGEGIYDISEHKSVLKDGVNVIAVEIQQVWGGFGVDLSLKAAGVSPNPKDLDGTVFVKSAEMVGFYVFGGGFNAPSNMFDGNGGTCSGSGRNEEVEQSWTVNFYGNVPVTEIYIQCKGFEEDLANEKTTHEDGITFGYYNIYVGDQLVAARVPARSGVSGGYTCKFSSPVTASSVKVELTDKWYSENTTRWANISELSIKSTEAAEEAATYEGYQAGTDGSSLRFIGGVDSLSYTTADLQIAVEGGKIYTNASSKVYNALLAGDTTAVATVASGIEATETVDAAALFGYALVEIPAGTYNFTIIPVAAFIH